MKKEKSETEIRENIFEELESQKITPLFIIGYIPDFNNKNGVEIEFRTLRTKQFYNNEQVEEKIKNAIFEYYNSNNNYTGTGIVDISKFTN
jgi:hypothetical protein